MDEIVPQKPVIPLAQCPDCGEERVLYGFWNEARGCLQRRCTVCDRVIEPGPGSEIEYLAPGELEDTGFAVTEALPADGGCGGNCASGSCDTCDQVETCAKVH